MAGPTPTLEAMLIDQTTKNKPASSTAMQETSKVKNDKGYVWMYECLNGRECPYGTSQGGKRE
jgi:hypothetical protein